LPWSIGKPFAIRPIPGDHFFQLPHEQSKNSSFLHNLFNHFSGIKGFLELVKWKIKFADAGLPGSLRFIYNLSSRGEMLGPILATLFHLQNVCQGQKSFNNFRLFPLKGVEPPGRGFLPFPLIFPPREKSFPS
jgi:hypothetical protein